jgi:hypothetical protein
MRRWVRGSTTMTVGVLVVALGLLNACSAASPPGDPVDATDVADAQARETELAPAAARTDARKKPSKSTTTSTPAEPTATTTVTTTTTTSAVPSSPSSLIGQWRGAYTPHGWIAAPKSVDYVRDRVRELEAAGFSHQLHNIGVFDADGRMAESDHAGLARWIEVSRTTEPQQQIIAWVNGHEAAHVNRSSTHARIADWVAHATTELGVDGVMLDFEPFTRDNAQLLELLDAIRRSAPRAWVGIASPAERWSEPFIGQVADRVDLLSPMIYDSALTRPADYSELVRRTVSTYRHAMAGRAGLAPSLPAYSANPWHDPVIENLATAAAGLHAAAAEGATVDGAAVYWWWEMGELDLRFWRDLIAQ